jgi:hypothetical protein
MLMTMSFSFPELVLTDAPRFNEEALTYWAGFLSNCVGPGFKRLAEPYGAIEAIDIAGCQSI